MKRRPDLEEFVESGLDHISSFGEFLGRSLGSMGRTMQKIVIGVGILFIFGIAAFVWAMGKGMFKKK